MSRYPYTEACDAMRAKTDYKAGQGITFSRYEASLVLRFIAEALGMDDHALACKIADHARKQAGDAGGGS